MVDGILVFEKLRSIKKKIIACSHQEYNKEKFTNIKNIENKILSGKDLFDRSIEYKAVEIDSSFQNIL